MYCKFYKYLKLQNYTISNCIKHFLNMFIVKVAFSGRSKQWRLRFHFPYKLPRHPTCSNKNKNTSNSSMSRVIIIWKIWHQSKKKYKHARRSPVKFFFLLLLISLETKTQSSHNYWLRFFKNGSMILLVASIHGKQQFTVSDCHIWNIYFFLLY